tara:strand:- start:1355 stop:2368 length:1014 start_codon:yes stop_codon:yes gene_type:complete
MKVAINNTDLGFRNRWITYCEENNIDFTLVDCYSNDIIKDLKGFDALLWNWYHDDPKANIFAKQLLKSVEDIGLKVFPNTNTCFFYDDKIGQKYLLESINAPFINTYIFYEENAANTFIESSDYPLVFKLNRGAGSSNVFLIKSKSEAQKIVRKAFSKGFNAIDRGNLWKDARRELSHKFCKSNLIKLLKATYRLIFKTEFEKMSPKEKGVVYFQEFIPKNDFDIRIIVVGNKAFGVRRYCRPNDFRASGSGRITYEKSELDEECVKISFKIAKKTRTQSLALDFVYKNGEPLIVELSYTFSMESYNNCTGFWDENLNWNKGQFNPQAWMIKDLLDS